MGVVREDIKLVGVEEEDAIDRVGSRDVVR